MCYTCISRRRFLTAGAALGLTGATAACDQIDLISDAEVEQMGLQSWQQIRQKTPLSRDASARDLLADITGRLLRAAGENPGDWEIAAFASDDINAFALPGRKIGVFEGMLRLVSTRDQLAAVIGHEIGHLQAEHGKERMEAQLAKQTGQRLLQWLLAAGEVQFAEEIAAALGMGVEFGLVLPFSRDQELEADTIGLRHMAEAGYDPREAITLWQRMEQATGRRGPEFLATHPAPSSRIARIREMLPELTRA